MTRESRSRQASLDRRTFLAGAAVCASALGSPRAAFANPPSSETPEICAFIKFVQSLSYDAMAQAFAEIGFDGIESTVRKGGHVLPERVEEDLPRQHEAVTNAGLNITIMTTDVLSVDQPYTEQVLRAGASLGIKKYRMGFYRYDRRRGVIEQLDEIRPRLSDLAAMNRELGITAVYQNHSGADYVGAPVWDAYHLLKNHAVEDMAMAFDIRHATIEGGLAWPLHYELMKPHIGAVYAKDFEWVGDKAEHVPLGSGRVDKEFFDMHVASGIGCPISLHVEYLKDGDAKENLAALKRDLATLRGWLATRS